MSIRSAVSRLRLRTSVLLALAMAIVVPSLAFGHAVVYPKASAAGAYERYVLRVPNEKAVATTRVELRVPDGMRVTAFAEVPGWTLEVLTDTANRVIGAVWTGSLAPKRFVEFPFVGANPKEMGAVTWVAYQTYAGDERVEWSGPEGSKTPASVTKIGPSAAAADSAAAAANVGSPAGAPAWVGWSALVLAFLGLGLGLRRS